MASNCKSDQCDQRDGVASCESVNCKLVQRNSVQLPARAATPKLVIVLVGLPARGKTYIAQKLARFLRWTGVNTTVFNTDKYRRQALGKYPGNEFFRADNAEAQRIRLQYELQALDDITKWLNDSGGEIAVLDSTNTTREKRNQIFKICNERQHEVLFVESYCDDITINEENLRNVRSRSPDYENMDESVATADLHNRVSHYEAQYEPLDVKQDSAMSFIRIHNAGQHFVLNEVSGRIQTKVVDFLINNRFTKHTIYLCRHGESEDNQMGRVGGDSSLTENGREFAQRLSKFVEHEQENKRLARPLPVWTSYLHRTLETAEHIRDASLHPWKALNELHAGVCDGMTYEEIQAQFPEEFACRDKHKFLFRYHMGEDVVARLEPVVLELGRQSEVLVICHQAIVRCLLAYFLDLPNEELPYVEVPLHTILKLTPVAYGCELERVPLNIPAVSTYRAKPTNVEAGRTDDEALSTVPEHF